MAFPQHSIADNLKAWKNVVKTTVEEGNKAGASEKARWLEAQQKAEGVVEKLAEVSKLEKAASKAFFAAQKKQPMLKLVSNGD